MFHLCFAWNIDSSVLIKLILVLQFQPYRLQFQLIQQHHKWQLVGGWIVKTIRQTHWPNNMIKYTCLILLVPWRRTMAVMRSISLLDYNFLSDASIFLPQRYVELISNSCGLDAQEESSMITREDRRRTKPWAGSFLDQSDANYANNLQLVQSNSLSLSSSPSIIDYTNTNRPITR